MSKSNVPAKARARGPIGACTNLLHGILSTLAPASRGRFAALARIDLSCSRAMSRTLDTVLNCSEGETLGVVEINKAVDSNGSN